MPPAWNLSAQRPEILLADFEGTNHGWDWGNMHWGHAVTTDQVHWVEWPIALCPYRFGDRAFSGSAVVDWQNTAGFKTGKDDVRVAAYTGTGRGEASELKSIWPRAIPG